MLAVVLLACGRRHDLQEGAYRLQAEEILRDICGLAGGLGPL